MSDRELLELAALAAGYVIHEHSEHGAWVYARDAIKNSYVKYPVVYWTPKHDDGDALRLAVKLAMNIEFYPSSNTVFVEGIENGLLFDEFLGNDPCAATRRAVVMVAAEIGKQMKEQTP